MTAKLFSRLSTVGMLWLACGCASTGWLKFSKDDFPKAGPKNPIVQVLALWQPADGTGIDGKTSRGFSGQILLFTNQGPMPAEGDGSVRVYVFDDQGKPEDRAKPIHQFDFPAETWKHYMHKGKLGPTYSVFVPYTRPGYRAAQCSLRMRFTPANGPAIFSEMVNVELPGTKAATEPAQLIGTGSDAKSSGSAPQDESAATRFPKRKQDALGGAQDVIQQVAAEQSVLAPIKRAHSAVPLTEAERQRIIRETRMKMKQDGRSPGRIDEEESESEEFEPRSVRSASHVMDDEPEEDAAADADEDHLLTPRTTPRNIRQSRNSPNRKPGRTHPLEQSDARNTPENGRKKFESFTIDMSDGG